MIDKVFGILDSIEKSVYPPHCLACGEIMIVNQWQQHMCVDCKNGLKFIGEDTCENCGEILGFCEICPVCRNSSKYFSRGIGLFHYSDVQDGIHNMKFSNLKHHGYIFGEMMGKFMIQEYRDWLEIIDVLVPVPMHKNKFKERGFNQAEELVRGISDVVGIRYSNDTLIKYRESKNQSSTKGNRRSENIKGVFKCGNDSCDGLNVLLVDDVYTTGSTADECCLELLKAGANEVFFVALALS